MKKIVQITIVLMGLCIILPSCGGKKDGSDDSGRKVLTERIQYDVFIKTPNPDFDWWVQNIEGSKRESFVKTFLNLAYDGKVKAYDYFNKPLTPEEVKKIGNFTDTTYVEDSINPNITNKIAVKHTLDIQEITKVRFLEEWYLDEKGMSFEKKVVGMMLMKTRILDSLEPALNVPLFWIYFDDKYPAKMK